MSTEKTNLLSGADSPTPSAPQPPPPSYYRYTNDNGNTVTVYPQQQQQQQPRYSFQPANRGSSNGAKFGDFRVIIVPGVEFDTRRRSLYGCHAFFAAALLLAAFVLVELRDCQWSPGIDLDKLQALHVSLMVLSGVLYVLSLFAIAELLAENRFIFALLALVFYSIAALVIWTTFQAATSPCVKTFRQVPVDFGLDILSNAASGLSSASSSTMQNVFSRGDKIGMLVLLLDALAALAMLSSATNFIRLR